jgi:large subunit ribosomal protein L17
MRHRNSRRKLSMDGTQRRAMFRNMVTSLLQHGQIETTLAKARELRGVADRVISIGKRAPVLAGLEGTALADATASRVAAIRRAAVWVHDDETLRRLFGELAERYRLRPGGYTRVVKVGLRTGDQAPMAVVQLVDSASADAQPLAEASAG